MSNFDNEILRLLVSSFGLVFLNSENNTPNINTLSGFIIIVFSFEEISSYYLNGMNVDSSNFLSIASKHHFKWAHYFIAK